ncbi:MAG: NAD(P)/FAD-dependent oxidoreductase, partial [Panacagrimonas sp.]
MAQFARSADALVIGAGVIGLSTGLALRQAGLRVTVLERGAVGRGSASWAGGGILSALEPGGVDDATLPILRDSLAMYPGWCERVQDLSGIDPEYRVSGMQVQAPAEAAQWKAFFETRCGLRVEAAPATAGKGDAIAWLPDVAQVRSPRLLRALAAAFAAAGGVLTEHEPVLGLERQGNRITGVRAAGGVHRARVV